MTEARDQLGQLVNRAEYNGERMVLTRNGRAVAAIVPMEVLRNLEAAEDEGPTHRAAAEPGPNVPHAEVWSDLLTGEAPHRRACVQGYRFCDIGLDAVATLIY